MRKWLIGSGILGVLLITLLVGSLAVTAFAQTPIPPQTETEEQADTGPDEQVPSYDSAIRVDDAQYEGMSEADEAAALAGQATVTPEEAEAAALSANPGTTAVTVELDNENGALVYSVELDSGLDVKVDAGNGTVLHTEQADTDEAGATDTDDVQEEFESQADDATEAPGIEDAPGQ